MALPGARPYEPRNYSFDLADNKIICSRFLKWPPVKLTTQRIHEPSPLFDPFLPSSSNIDQPVFRKELLGKRPLHTSASSSNLSGFVASTQDDVKKMKKSSSLGSLKDPLQETSHNNHIEEYFKVRKKLTLDGNDSGKTQGFQDGHRSFKTNRSPIDNLSRPVVNQAKENILYQNHGKIFKPTDTFDKSLKFHPNKPGQFKAGGSGLTNPQFSGNSSDEKKPNPVLRPEDIELPPPKHRAFKRRSNPYAVGGPEVNKVQNVLSKPITDEAEKQNTESSLPKLKLTLAKSKGTAEQSFEIVSGKIKPRTSRLSSDSSSSSEDLSDLDSPRSGSSGSSNRSKISSTGSFNSDKSKISNTGSFNSDKSKISNTGSFNSDKSKISNTGSMNSDRSKISNESVPIDESPIMKKTDSTTNDKPKKRGRPKGSTNRKKDPDFVPKSVKQQLPSTTNNQPTTRKKLIKPEIPPIMKKISAAETVNFDPGQFDLEQTPGWARELVLRSCRYRHTFIDAHCDVEAMDEALRQHSKFTMQKHTLPFNYAGVVAAFSNPATYDKSGKQGLLTVVLQRDDAWLTFGCLPKHADTFTAAHLKSLRQVLANERCVGLGPCGLNYSLKTNTDQQKFVFKSQLVVAVQLNKTLVLHCKSADDDCLMMLNKFVPTNHVIHVQGFSGNKPTVKKWTKTFPNMYFGLTPAIAQSSGQTALREMVNALPLDRILLESGAPYIIPKEFMEAVPMTHYGFALFTAKALADIKRMSTDEVLRICRSNIKQVYGI